MASSSSSFLSLVPLLLLFLAVAVETRPSPQRDEEQVSRSLFGSRLSSLLLAPPASYDVTEGSVARPASSFSPSGGSVGRQEAARRFFLDFLQRQAKMRRRGRNSMVGGRGCFRMKMDRIGSVSGLGC